MVGTGTKHMTSPEMIFPSLRLLRRFCDQDIKITGRTRSSRLEKCPILNSNQLEKKTKKIL